MVVTLASAVESPVATPEEDRQGIPSGCRLLLLLHSAATAALHQGADTRDAFDPERGVLPPSRSLGLQSESGSWTGL